MAGYLVAWLVEGAVLLSLPVLTTVFYYRRHPDPGSRARFARRAGMTMVGSFAVFVTLTLTGEALSDPGGWRGIGLIAAWVIPLVLLTGFAWTRPVSSAPLLGALTWLTVLVVGLSGAEQRIADLEDRVGPITLVIFFVVMVPVAALGHSDPRSAAELLLVLALVPTVMALIVSPEAGRTSALVLFAFPLCVTAALYLAAARIKDQARQHQRAVVNHWRHGHAG